MKPLGLFVLLWAATVLGAHLPECPYEKLAPTRKLTLKDILFPYSRVMPLVGKKGIQAELMNAGKAEPFAFPYSRDSAIEGLDPRVRLSDLKPEQMVRDDKGHPVKFIEVDEDGRMLLEKVHGNTTTYLNPHVLPKVESAHRYRVVLTDPSDRSQTHALEVVIPAHRDGDRNTYQLDEVKKALAALPYDVAKGIDLIRANPDAYFRVESHLPPDQRIQGFAGSSPTASGQHRRIDFFPTALSEAEVTLFVMRHEVGHILGLHRAGRFAPPGWAETARRDKTKSVSEYGDKNMDEDFAETMRIYLASDAGLKGRYRQEYPLRFRYIDAMLGIETKLVETKRNLRFSATSAIGSGITAGMLLVGGKLLLVLNDDDKKKKEEREKEKKDDLK